MTTIRIWGAPAPAELPDVASFTGLGSALVSDAMDRVGATGDLRPLPGTLVPGRAVAGWALTVKTEPGDNLAVHCALDLIESGQVLVIDGRGRLDRALIGELIVRSAAAAGAVAVVVDGAVRDADELAGLGVPVLARGVSPLGPWKNGPGEVGGPVAIGSELVNSGDLILVDGDGLAIVPRARAGSVADRARGLAAAEQEHRSAIAAGTVDRSWVAERARLEIVDAPPAR